MDYKNTLLLPKTDFPMRAELPKREPTLLAKWREEKNLRPDSCWPPGRRPKARDTTFILHDGPPFANGDAHMGHALNMVLKDIVLKYQNKSGHYAPFVPGWGLPRPPHRAQSHEGTRRRRKPDPIKIREKCEATARHFIDVQREQFQRLGVFGDWDNPYLTLDPAYEAETLPRSSPRSSKKNLGLPGPAPPSSGAPAARPPLAEAEIEYKEKVDPAIYVKFPV